MQFYFECDELASPANKPTHLADRSLNRTDALPLQESLINSERRRIDILNQRKAKLQTRGSHVKKVVDVKRCQEKENKLIQQTKLQCELTEASQKRSEIIQHRKTLFAAQVLRAKNVARNHYRRLAEDMARKKNNLDENLAFVAARRLRLLKTPRSRLLEPHLLSDEDLVQMKTVRLEAIVHLQQWWRRRKFAPLIGDFVKLSISLKVAEQLSFEKLVKKFQEKKCIQITSRLFSAIRKTTVDKFSSLWKTPTRTFLSAYMIATHPQETMPNNGPSEKQLSDISRKMLTHFEAWLDGYTTPKTFSLFSNLTKSINEFFDAFESWKAQDTKELAEGMISHWINLEKLWLTVRHQPDVEENWRPKIEAQQLHIQKKLQKLGSVALHKLYEAQLAMTAEQQVAEDNASDDQAALISTSPKRFPVFQRQQANFSDSVSGSSAASSTSSSITREPSPVNMPSIQNEKPQQQQNVNVQEIMNSFGKEFSAEYLAHELTLDPEFEIKPRVLTPLEAQVKAMAKSAFFDSVREEFSKGEYLRFCPGLIEDIKKNLLSMIPENGKLAQEVHEQLDTELIYQQITHKVFDLRNTISYILQKMQQLCAPIRDAQIRDLSKHTDVVSLFAEIMDIFELMKYDLMNYRLQSIRPVLKQQAVQYEREKFTAALAAHAVSLEKTTNWLKDNVALQTSLVQSRNPENVETPHQRVKFETTFNEGILSLIFSVTSLSVETCPETLTLDAHRIFAFQNEIQALTIVSALLMLIKNTCPELRNDNAAVKKLKDTLLILLSSNGTTIDHLATQLEDTMMSYSSKKSEEELTKLKEMIKGMVSKTLSLKDPVYGLINRRILQSTKSHLANDVFKREGLASAGLADVGQELQVLSQKIVHFVKYNKQVYGEWYDEILRVVSV